MFAKSGCREVVLYNSSIEAMNTRGCFRDGVSNFSKLNRANQRFHLIVVWPQSKKQKI